MKPPRSAHVKRIYAVDETDKDNPIVNKDVWIDVLRIDNVLLNYRGMRGNGVQHTDFRYHFKWLDDKAEDNAGDVQGENGNKSRKVQSLAVHNPETPDDDKDIDIKLYLIWRQHVHLPTQYFDRYKDWIPSTGWFFEHSHDNAPADGSGPDVSDPLNVGAPTKPAKRDVAKVRVSHVDLPDDFDISVPVKWDDYEKVLQKAVDDGKADKSQYVDEEVLKKFKFTYAGRAKGPAEIYADYFKNSDLIKLIDAGGEDRQSKDPTPSDPAGTPNNDGKVPKLYRLDPLQTIVNVQWSILVLAWGTQSASQHSVLDDDIGLSSNLYIPGCGPPPFTSPGIFGGGVIWLKQITLSVVNGTAIYRISGTSSKRIDDNTWHVSGFPPSAAPDTVPDHMVGGASFDPPFEETLTFSGGTIPSSIGDFRTDLEVTVNLSSAYGQYLFTGENYYNAAIAQEPTPGYEVGCVIDGIPVYYKDEPNYAIWELAFGTMSLATHTFSFSDVVVTHETESGTETYVPIGVNSSFLLLRRQSVG